MPLNHTEEVCADGYACRWFGTNLGEKNEKAGSKRAIDSSVVGRYMQTTNQPAAPSDLTAPDDDLPVTKKAKRKGAGFGNFEGW